MLAVSKNKEYFLIIQLAKGNQHAFKELYYMYAAAIRLNIAKLIKDAETVDDLLQEVFITLWESRLSIDANKGIAPWLYTVSYNRALKFLRKKMKEVQMVSDNTIDLSLFSDSVNGPQGDEADLAVIHAALDKLPFRKKMAFFEYKLKGKTLDEVADKMGITKDAVKGYLKDARKFILQYIKKNESSSTETTICFLLWIFTF